MDIYPVEIQPSEPDRRAAVVMISGESPMDVGLKLIEKYGMCDDYDFSCNSKDNKLFVRAKKHGTEEYAWYIIAVVHDLVESDHEEIMQAMRFTELFW